MSSTDMNHDTREETVPASRFSREFGKYRDDATAGKIVKVSAHGRIIGAYISAAEFEHYKALKRRERQVYTAGDIPDDIMEDIENAEYGK